MTICYARTQAMWQREPFEITTAVCVVQWVGKPENPLQAVLLSWLHLTVAFKLATLITVAFLNRISLFRDRLPKHCNLVLIVPLYQLRDGFRQNALERTAIAMVSI